MALGALIVIGLFQTAWSCEFWCAAHPSYWTQKCEWSNCRGCSICNDDTCEGWCADHYETSWSTKCGWQACDGCSPCRPTCAAGARTPQPTSVCVQGQCSFNRAAFPMVTIADMPPCWYSDSGTNTAPKMCSDDADCLSCEYNPLMLLSSDPSDHVAACQCEPEQARGFCAEGGLCFGDLPGQGGPPCTGTDGVPTGAVGVQFCLSDEDCHSCTATSSNYYGSDHCQCSEPVAQRRALGARDLAVNETQINAWRAKLQDVKKSWQAQSWYKCAHESHAAAS